MRVVHIIDDWDMRMVHRLRSHPKARSLQKGECLMAFNRAITIARIVDCNGGVLQIWSRPGRQFDYDECLLLVKSGWDVDLRKGASTRSSISRIRVLKAA